MMDNFKKGFEKTAFISLQTILSILAPSVQKRVGAKAFEYSKRKAMGIPQEPSRVFDTIDSHIDKVRDMPKGLKKSTAEFFMEEGPGLAIYAPSKSGKEIGEVLQSALDAIPFGLGKKDSVKHFLADLTSADTATAMAAKARLDKGVGQLKATAGTLGAVGVAGAAGYGTTLGYQKLKENDLEELKKEELSAPLYISNPNSPQF